MINSNSMVRKLLSLLLVLVSLQVQAGDTLQVVLLGGQSNMAGRGVVADLDEAMLERIDAVALRVQVASQGKEAQPLSYAKPNKRATQFGPELFIGLTLAEKYPAQDFLMIKTAVGGTSLYGAWSPSWTQEKALASELGEKRQQMQLYTEHQAFIRSQLEKLDEQGRAYKLVGMAWMQGEKDTRRELTATTYEENLTALILAYRNDLNIDCLPFVFGQVNCPLRGKKDYAQGPEAVRTAMANVDKALDCTALIPTSMDTTWGDYPKHDDNVHYNAEGQMKLGTAMANALEGLW